MQGSFVQVHGFDVRGTAPGTSAKAGAKQKDQQQQASKPNETGFNGLMQLCTAVSMGVIRETPANHGQIVVVGTARVSLGVRSMVKSVVRGLKALQQPDAASEGLGGTYFFKDEHGVPCAIAKPCDEEPLAPGNPKGYVGRQLGDPGLKPTVRVGEAAIREVAAYLLDHNHFSGVPHTVLVKITHPCFHMPAGTASSLAPGASQQLLSAGVSMQPAGVMAAVPEDGGIKDGLSPAGMPGLLKQASLAAQLHRSPSMAAFNTAPCKLGSLQEFVSHDCDTSDMGTSRFSVSDVHRIGILDLRLFNTDRHAGNILVRKVRRSSSSNMGALARLQERQVELMPIDHGFCLPEAPEAPYFEWLYWPQALIPFSKEELEFIAGLDAGADVALLKQELPSLREECLRMLEVATTLLQRCAASGLTLAEIATVVTRPAVGMDEEPSDMENMCMWARQEVDSAAEQGTVAQMLQEQASLGDDEDDLSAIDEDEAAEAEDRLPSLKNSNMKTPFALHAEPFAIDPTGVNRAVLLPLGVENASFNHRISRALTREGALCSSSSSFDSIKGIAPIPEADSPDGTQHAQQAALQAQQARHRSTELMFDFDGNSEPPTPVHDNHSTAASPLPPALSAAAMQMHHTLQQQHSQQPQGPSVTKAAGSSDLSHAHSQPQPVARSPAKGAHHSSPDSVINSSIEMSPRLQADVMPVAHRSSSISISAKPSTRFALPEPVVDSADSADAGSSSYSASPDMPRGANLGAGLAKSVFPATGHAAWQEFKARVRGRRRNGSKLSAARLPGNPGGLGCDAPQSGVNINDVFRDMDEQQWRYFMVVMIEQIDDALREGRWKGTQQASARSAITGMSCP